MRRIILLTFILFTPFGFLHAQKIYVLSVGVTDYPGTQSDLNLTVNDAKTIKWVYDKNKKAETLLLTNAQATRQNVLYHMNKLFLKATENDIVLFFFSGHGYQGGFVGYNTDLITYTDIKNIMAKSASKNKMIFADACYSGKFRESKTSSSPSVAPSDLNVLLFLSSRSNETSIESPRMTNGFFTTYLQKALRGNADANRDRKITAKELFTYVNKGVVDLSRGKQHPVMWGKFSDSMPVIVW
ncbi:MAG: caspase family protein [Rikenellaceae bacterium]